MLYPKFYTCCFWLTLFFVFYFLGILVVGTTKYANTPPFGCRNDEKRKKCLPFGCRNDEKRKKCPSGNRRRDEKRKKCLSCNRRRDEKRRKCLSDNRRRDEKRRKRLRQPPARRKMQEMPLPLIPFSPPFVPAVPFLFCRSGK